MNRYWVHFSTQEVSYEYSYYFISFLYRNFIIAYLITGHFYINAFSYIKCSLIHTFPVYNKTTTIVLNPPTRTRCQLRRNRFPYICSI